MPVKNLGVGIDACDAGQSCEKWRGQSMCVQYGTCHGYSLTSGTSTRTGANGQYLFLSRLGVSVSQRCDSAASLHSQEKEEETQARCCSTPVSNWKRLNRWSSREKVCGCGTVRANLASPIWWHTTLIYILVYVSVLIAPSVASRHILPRWYATLVQQSVFYFCVRVYIRQDYWLAA